MTFHHTHVSEAAIERVVATLQSTFISEGKQVREFESELAKQIGLVRPVALNSGTSALHLALEVAGVGPGDEVVIPPQTFVATGLAVLMCRANVVFADIQPQTGNLCPNSFTAKITPKTKAVIPVHWGGCPCDMDEINAIAAKHGITVIEDAAHALGATYKGRPIGSLSRFTCLSFQAIKHLTTGDGGAICCLTEDDEREVKRRRWFGIDRVRDLPTILGERDYNLADVGYKYHLNDFAAALGLGNLPDLPNHLARHRQIAARYAAELKDVPGYTHLTLPTDRVSSWWMYTGLVERREQFIRAMKDRGVPASVVHLRIDRNRVFGGLADLPGQAFFEERQVALPIHVGLMDDDVDKVVAAVRFGW